MSLKAKIKKDKNIAVFARNYRKYIEAAAARNRDNPQQLTTFRSAVTWRSAHKAIDEHGEIPIYFCPKDSDKGVEYEALLHQVHLDPIAGEPETMKALEPV